MTEEQMKNEHEESVQTPQTEGGKKYQLKTWQMFLIGLVIILLVALGVVYAVAAKGTKSLSQSPFVMKSAQMFGLPIARVEGEKVLYTDYISDLNTLNRFYSKKPEGFPDATPEQISDQVLSRLVANQLISQVAKQYKVSINEDDVNKFKDELLKQFPDRKKAEDELMDKYGWTLDTYVNKVVRPIVLEQKLQQVFASSTDEAGKEFETAEVRASHILFLLGQDDVDATVKVKAQKVLDEIKAGADFAEMAKKYGSDSTKDNGGDLGWFTRGQMVKEFEDAAFNLGVGEMSELVKTQYGYHIIKVSEMRTARDFVAFMNDLLKNAKVEIFSEKVHDPFSALKAQPQVEVQPVETIETK